MRHYEHYYMGSMLNDIFHLAHNITLASALNDDGDLNGRDKQK